MMLINLSTTGHNSFSNLLVLEFIFLMISFMKDANFSILKHFLKCQFQLYIGQNKSERQNCGNEFSAMGDTQLDILIFYFKIILFSVHSNKMFNVC